MMRWLLATGLLVSLTVACGGDDDGGGSGGSATGGTSSGGTSSGGSGGSTSGGTGGAAGASTGGSGGSTGGSGGSTGGSGGSTGGSGGSTGGSGGSTGGSGGVSKDCNGQAFVASCKATGGGCVDYFGAAWSAAVVKSGCESGGKGTSSTSKCVTAGNVGACASSIGTTSCTVGYSFAPVTSNMAQQICTASGGTFHPA